MKNVNSIRAAMGPAVADLARDVEDDFYCLRFRVWYPSFDCAFRTRYRTCPSCGDCEQGRFNLKRHAPALARSRRPFGRR
jgi:hypothetical protein